MTDYRLSPRALVLTSGSSKGTQKKYFDGTYWYKENRTGQEGLAENLASEVLKCSNLTNFVEYDLYKVNGRPGCRSKNFLKENEMFLSFERLHVMQTGMYMNDAILGKNSIEERMLYVIDFIKSCTGFDPSEYLGNILMFDALILNQDRHFNNLGVIINQNTEEVRECPIFDNGDSFLSNFTKFPPLDSIEECLNKCVSLPFSANAYMQAKILPHSLKLDYDALEKRLESFTKCRATEVLRRQIELYRGIIPEISKERKLSLQEQIKQAKADSRTAELNHNIAAKNDIDLSR